MTDVYFFLFLKRNHPNVSFCQFNVHLKNLIYSLVKSSWSPCKWWLSVNNRTVYTSKRSTLSLRPVSRETDQCHLIDKKHELSLFHCKEKFITWWVETVVKSEWKKKKWSVVLIIPNSRRPPPWVYKCRSKVTYYLLLFKSVVWLRLPFKNECSR